MLLRGTDVLEPGRGTARGLVSMSPGNALILQEDLCFYRKSDGILYRSRSISNI